MGTIFMSESHMSPLRSSTIVIPESLWYNVGPDVLYSDVIDFVNEVATKLREHNELLGINLVNISLFKELNQGKSNSSVDYKDGPLALLLIYALRTHLNLKYQITDAVQVCDDIGRFLPDRFEQLDQYLDEFFDAYCVANGWHRQGDFLLKGKSILLESAALFGREMFTSLEKIRPFAVTMGCLPNYVDLSLVKTSVHSAFF